MNDHPCGFVDGDQRIVLVEDVERERFRDGALTYTRPKGQLHFDGGSFTDVHRRPAGRRPIDRYQTLGYPSLRTGPRHSRNLRDAPDQHLIQSQTRVATIRGEMNNQDLLLVYLCQMPTITHLTVEG